MVVLEIIGFILTLPWKWAMAALKLDHPNIVFGGLSANVADRRVPYQRWYHLKCVNEKRAGWRGKVSPSRDAHVCRVSLELKPSSGDAPPLNDDAIFTLGATSELVTTLFVEKAVSIPIYWVANTNSASTPHGRAVTKGYYLTGAEWVLHPNLWHKWRIDPGIYRLTVTVTWEGQPFEYESELVSPVQQ